MTTTYSYFAPVLFQEQGNIAPPIPNYFEHGVEKPPISRSIPVDKTLISTPYDWLQSKYDYEQRLQPLEVQDKKQLEFISKSGTEFIIPQAGWYEASLQSTYLNQSLNYEPIRKGEFEDPLRRTKIAEEERHRIAIPLFF